LKALVAWQINESIVMKSGIPNRIRTAVLLRRYDDKKFEMEQDIILTMSGFSFDRAAGRNLGTIGRAVIPIDPDFQNWTLDKVDTQNLGKIDLNPLLAVAASQDQYHTTEEIDHQRHDAIQTAIGAIQRQQTLVDQPLPAEPIQPIGVGKYFFAELWNRDCKSTAITNPATAAHKMKLKQELGILDDALLRQYFPYVYEELALPSIVS
jgi:hypothetical protein